MKRYTILISQNSWDQTLEPYRLSIKSGVVPGKLLQNRLSKNPAAIDSALSFLFELMNTKRPQIFAESAVVGNGLDWNMTELAILGDVSIATPVQMFDNGLHRYPKIHTEPLAGTLLFTPGALLKNGYGEPPADYLAVTTDHQIDPEKYYRLYERRLIPPLLYANQVCAQKQKMGFVTIPGLGCGVFAGKFHHQLGEHLNWTLQRLLKKYANELTDIRAVYFDPYRECQNERHEIDGLSYMVRPLSQGNENKPQLCFPETYEEDGDNFADCEFFSFVAWDHVSWPGNDFYVGSRATDDGVKGAATDALGAMTGFDGVYNKSKFMYLPPTGYSNWLSVINEHGLEIEVSQANLQIWPMVG